MKVVFDTNVLISALSWKGSPRQVVELAIDQRIQSATSLDILKELQDVLTNSFDLPPAKIQDVIKDTLSYSQIVKVKPLKANVRDVEDVKILACAVSAKAQYIVTGDKDLLVLGQYKSVKMITPGELLVRIK